MAKIFKYAFLTSTLACLFIAVPYLIIALFSLSGELMISTVLRMTLVYVFLVPWLGSTLLLVLALLIFGLEGGTKRRLLSGLSLGVVSLAVWLWDFMQDLIQWHHANVSPTTAIWLLACFGAGYLAAFIVDKIVKPEIDV